MPTKNDANLSVLSAPTAHLRIGPHVDIHNCCEFEAAVWEDEPDAERIVMISDLVKSALMADSVIERVIAAKRALEETNDGCGIAWLVLAREGADSPEQAEVFARKAVERLKQEHIANDLFAVQADLQPYALSVAELAQLTWNAGEHDEAIQMLTTCLRDEEDMFDGSDAAVVRDLAVSFLIQSGAGKDAQILLHSDTADDAEWHYLNALTHYCISGDSMVSRSALACALTKGMVTADRLVKGEASMFTPTVKAFGLLRNIKDTLPAWQATTGAMEWLDKFYRNPFKMHNSRTLECSVPTGDQKRWTRWQDTFDRADHLMMREDVKEAKKLYKTALREAERIDYSFVPFHDAIVQLLDMAEENEEPFDELRSRIESRAARFDSESSAAEPMRALNLHALASLFEMMDDYETAALYYEKANTLMQRQFDQGCPSLTLVDVEETQSDLAYSLFELKRYSEAIPLLMRNLETSDRYLGRSNVTSLRSLGLVYQCFRHVDDAEGSRAIEDRIKAIDESYLGTTVTGSFKCDGCGMQHD